MIRKTVEKGNTFKDVLFFVLCLCVNKEICQINREVAVLNATLYVGETCRIIRGNNMTCRWRESE